MGTLPYSVCGLSRARPEDLRHRETRLAKIREAKRALEEKAREKAEAEGKDPETAKPADKDQHNFTDSESRIMKGSDGFVQAYNAQAAVEETFQLIVGQSVTQEANDKKQVEPMVEVIEAQSGQKPDQLLADSGYCSEQNLKYLVPCRPGDYHRRTAETALLACRMVTSPTPRGYSRSQGR